MLPQDRFKPVETTTKKKNGIKIAKGVVFLLLAVLFLFIVFYDINQNYDGKPFDFFYENRDFDEYFRNTYLNFAVSVLFAVLGILELKEGATNGN